MSKCSWCMGDGEVGVIDPNDGITKNIPCPNCNADVTKSPAQNIYDALNKEGKL